MKKRLISIALLLSIFLLISCSNSLTITSIMAPEVCGYYAFPIASDPDLKGESASIIEEDEYGRVLFENTVKTFHNDTLTYTMIMQKWDKNNVYYYEDICYCIGNHDTVDLDSLKSANDWGKPIDDDKLDVRSATVTFDLYITNKTPAYSKIKSLIEKALNINASDIEQICITDVKNEKSMYWCKVNKLGKSEEYFVIIEEGNDPLLFETDDSFGNIDKLHEFRIDSGW